MTKHQGMTKRRMTKFVGPTRFEFGALPLFRIWSFVLRHLVIRFHIRAFGRRMEIDASMLEN
jgi:hypothetical protein